MGIIALVLGVHGGRCVTNRESAFTLSVVDDTSVYEETEEGETGGMGLAKAKQVEKDSSDSKMVAKDTHNMQTPSTTVPVVLTPTILKINITAQNTVWITFTMRKNRGLRVLLARLTMHTISRARHTMMRMATTMAIARAPPALPEKEL